MNTVLRVILIDDSKVDAELILYEISKSYNVEHAILDNENDLRQSIIEKNWDVVLCDYSMPNLDPYRVLNILRENDIDIPLLVISGTIGEDNAIKLLKAGCCDCIMKSNLTRLPGVIDREIKEEGIRKENRELNKNLIYERDRSRQYFELANVIFVVLDKKGNVQDINKKGCEMLEYSKEDIIGKNWFDNFIPQSNIKEVKSVYDKVVSGKTNNVKFYENPIVTSKGEEKTISWHNNTIKDESGQISFIVSAGNDVTDEKKAKEALAESEARYKTLFENSGIAIMYYKTNGAIISFNKQAAKNMGGVPKDFLGKSIYELFPKKNADLYMERIAKSVLNDEPQEYETQVEVPNGLKWYSSIYNRVMGENGKVIGVQIASLDITERKESEVALKESQAFLKAAFDNSQAGIAIAVPPDGKLRYVNKAGLLIRDKSEEYLVKDIDYHKYVGTWNILHLDGTPYEEDEVPLTRATIYGKEVTEEFIIRRDNFEDRIVLAKAAPIKDENNKVIAGIVIFLDITDQKALEKERGLLEAQARNNQKLESIGTLASGVAHEINNPINGILNYGQIIIDSDADDKNIKTYAAEIIRETSRVAEIVKNLLDFSRQNGQEHSYSNIEDVILKTLSLINNIIKKDQIELDLHIDNELPQIKCRSQQIQQVLMNLMTNARDALNEKYPEYNENKKINLYCTQYSSDGRKWLKLIVEDFGVGISKDLLGKIFDPFFTTKGREKGTGLGLSISYGIVKEHHGEMLVETEEGEFSRFTVNLPCDNGWRHN